MANERCWMHSNRVVSHVVFQFVVVEVVVKRSWSSWKRRARPEGLVLDPLRSKRTCELHPAKCVELWAGFIDATDGDGGHNGTSSR